MSNRRPSLKELLSNPDAVLYRTKAEEEEWRARDPIESYAKRLIKEGLLDEGARKRMAAEADRVVDEAVKFAEESPEPDLSTLGDMIYAPREDA